MPPTLPDTRCRIRDARCRAGHPGPAVHRFLDSAFSFARNDTFFAVPSIRPDRGSPTSHPDRETGTTIQAVFPIEQRSDVSSCHPDRSRRRSGGICEQFPGGWADPASSIRFVGHGDGDGNRREPLAHGYRKSSIGAQFTRSAAAAPAFRATDMPQRTSSRPSVECASGLTTSLSPSSSARLAHHQSRSSR